jgi:hypothetical protein
MIDVPASIPHFAGLYGKGNKNDTQRITVVHMAKHSKCPVCSKRVSNGNAYFTFGAVIDLLYLKKKKLSDTMMEGFCHLGYHGVDPDMKDSADYTVGQGIKGGQSDIYFCSLGCLRKWLCDIVDYLERKSGQRRRSKPKRRRS